MCGIAGYWLKRPRNPDPRAVGELLEAVRERGPDDEGVCFLLRGKGEPRYFSTRQTMPSIASRLPHYESAAGQQPHDAALLHTRYAIIDLSEGGHQPYVSRDRSISLVFNGEIYNYVELREELEAAGLTFETTSDTEVLVEGYAHWGHALWEKMNGFWAIALHDARDGSIVLSRDRFGVAPLYYAEGGEGFWFSSAIRPLTDLDARGERPSSSFVHGFIETSLKDYDGQTCFEGVHALTPGTTVVFPQGCFRIADAEHHVFWKYPTQRLTEAELPFDEAVQRYRETFFNAVEIRMRADVKISFELSGGLDSSSVLAAACAMGHENLTSYTVKVPEFDEEPFARTMNDLYKLDYHVLEEPEFDFIEESAWFTRTMEEPYHSPNIYTHWKMRQQMKQEGTAVVLCGGGGDESLAGYENYFWPRAKEELIASGARGSAFRHQLGIDFRSWAKSRNTLRIKAKQLLGRPPDTNGNGSAHGAFPDPDNPAVRYKNGFRGLSFQDQCLYHFNVGLLQYYLRADDKFSMAIPIEHRLPLLDYRIVELGLSVPVSYLFHNGWTKYILRKAMEPYLPKQILWRKQKRGYPFATKRFLLAQRSHFEPLVRQVRDAGLLGSQGSADYDTLLAGSADRLWRICSVGFWLNRN